MSEKNTVNQRVMLTKRLIYEALLEMLNTCPITKISIRELCQLAGINRSTFYNHYGSQFDVLNDIAKTYLQSTSLTILKEMNAGKNITACLAQVLHYIKENRPFIKLILDEQNYDLVTHIKISLPQFDQMIMKHLPESLQMDEKQAIASYVQYGTVRLIKEWVFTECLKSPEEEAMLILLIAGRTIRN